MDKEIPPPIKRVPGTAWRTAEWNADLGRWIIMRRVAK